MSEPAAAPMEAVSTPQPSSENPVVQQAPAQRPKRKASEIENSHTAESIPAAKSQTVATKPPLPKLKSDAEEMKREADPERPCFGEPAEGKVRFHAIRNDGGVRNMLWLLQLKQIFSRQLPKMPPQYITRLIFDPHHVSLGLFHGHEPIGGIAYRPFYEQEYAEIAFCAITAKLQIRGYGTLLMNHLKAHVLPSGIRYFLTYADKFATGYFRKQGFSNKLTLRKMLWDGHIKHYDGAELMECAIIQHVDYNAIPRMLRHQRDYLYRCIREQTPSAVVYRSLDNDPKYFVNEPSKADQYAIPGVLESGWQQPEAASDDVCTGGNGAIKTESNSTPNDKRVDLQESLQSIFKELEATNFTWPFLKAVDPEEYPQYYVQISNPIDLSIIRTRVESKSYESKHAFLNDIGLMCANCRAFNTDPDNDFVACANKVEAFIRPRVEAIDVS